MTMVPRSRLSRKKRCVFALIVVVFLYGATEIGSLLAFLMIAGRGFSFSRLQRERSTQFVQRDTEPAGPRSEGLGYLTPCFMPHPYLGMVLNPEYRGPLPGYDRINEFGFCGPSSAIHKRAPDKLIVGIVGGSVACMFSAQGVSVLRDQFQAAPRYAGKKIVFVNLAVPGYKQPQQIMALDYALALGNEFDVLINLDGFNEIALYPQDGMARGAHPLFPFGYISMVGQLPDAASRELAGQLVHLRRKRESLARAFSGPLRFSVTANLLWRTRDRMLDSELARCQTALCSHKVSGHPLCSIGPPSDKLDSEDRLLDEMVAIWKRCGLQLERTCQGHGIRYHHFLQPNQYVPGSKELTASEKKAAWDEKWMARPWIEKGYPKLRQAGKELAAAGVPFTDLSMVYAGHDRTYYIDRCCHVNTDGNKVLAAAIARSLLETDEPPR